MSNCECGGRGYVKEVTTIKPKIIGWFFMLMNGMGLPIPHFGPDKIVSPVKCKKCGRKI